MDTFERSVHVEAALADVWEFHSSERGLKALTPDWMGLRVESVRGPDGKRNPATLEAGSLVRSSVCPFGIGPRHEWTSEILDRNRTDDFARFRDGMIDGPFDHWEHTHLFYATPDGTVVRDRVEYQLPGGVVGETLGPFAVIGLEPLFRHRHRRTREILE
jgi:ligand-binding SRPBCC domain-containing protein